MRQTTVVILSIVLVLGLAGAGLAQTSASKSKTPTAGKESKLMSPALLNEKAPPLYQVKFDTTKGEFLIDVTREWSPNGADRFYNLVKNGYYDGCRFFRVVAGFMAQFGINGDPQVNAAWNQAKIPDDPVKESNKRGYVTFAKSSLPNSRGTQVFINYVDRNAQLDSMGFSPFGIVTTGMEVVDALNSEYGDGAPRGKGPDQGQIQMQGNAYLEKDFPKLDYIKKAMIVPK
jgi:peptidyl-prolyl cis-trans isomerase A (cyclophilin A)